MNRTDVSDSTLTVLIPTLNASPMLEGHLTTMDRWLDLADEILVVDSYSNDGTVEQLKRALKGRPVRFIQHPPGLYQSWNHGIQQASGRWLYISTVGDPITRELLVHLRDIAMAGNCDVVVGNPQFIDEANTPLPSFQWAVTDMAQSFANHVPCELSPEAAIFLGVRHFQNSALLGSSASNLYRTAHIKAHPFPTQYGASGDAAWSMLHAFDTRFAYTSMPGSFFRIHRKRHAPAPENHALVLDAVLQAALDTCDALRPIDERLTALRIPELASLLKECTRWDDELKQLRKRCQGPWYFHPNIWSARRKRRRVRARLQSLISEGTELIRRNHVEAICVGKEDQEMTSSSAR